MALKCEMEVFYCINQKNPPIFTDKWGTHLIIKIFIKYENSS